MSDWKKLTGTDHEEIGSMGGLVVANTGQQETGRGVFVAYDSNEKAALTGLELSSSRHRESLGLYVLQSAEGKLPETGAGSGRKQSCSRQGVKTEGGKGCTRKSVGNMSSSAQQQQPRAVWQQRAQHWTGHCTALTAARFQRRAFLSF